MSSAFEMKARPRDVKDARDSKDAKEKDRECESASCCRKDLGRARERDKEDRAGREVPKLVSLGALYPRDMAR